MSKFKVSTREIGSVRVFDLEGSPTQESVQEVAWKIQKNIRRYRLQRVILNLQMVPSLEALGVRKLLAACIRPQRSLLYGVSDQVAVILESTYLPRNVKICPSEKEVAEDLGPFLMEYDSDKKVASPSLDPNRENIGQQVERRRSKRMHVALPIELRIHQQGSSGLIQTRAIATNISEGGLFAEYLDLEAAHEIEEIARLEGSKIEIHIFPSGNFPEEYHLEGKVVRKELRKKQLGLAIQFITPNENL